MRRPEPSGHRTRFLSHSNRSSLRLTCWEWSELVMAWRGSPRACFLNSVSKMWVTTSAARVAIALHGGKVRDKFCPLGIYLAYSASDVGFEQPSPVVIFDIPG